MDLKSSKKTDNSSQQEESEDDIEFVSVRRQFACKHNSAGGSPRDQ